MATIIYMILTAAALGTSVYLFRHQRRSLAIVMLVLTLMSAQLTYWSTATIEDDDGSNTDVPPAPTVTVAGS